MSGYWVSHQSVEERFPGCCQKSEFDCGDGKCISVSQFHDGQNDCIDGSDEFCLLGQIKCGSSQFCADPIHLTECFLFGLNSNCTKNNSLENVEKVVPSFCKFLNAANRPHLCHVHNSIFCRGYGQCILTKWIMDGKRDCLDGSDEDLEYVGLFNTSFGPFSSSLSPNKFTTSLKIQTTTETILDYSKINSSFEKQQLIWPPHGKIIKPIINSSNNKNIKQKSNKNETWKTTTPIYPFVKGRESKTNIKNEEKSEEKEKELKNIETETYKETTLSSIGEATLTDHTEKVEIITTLTIENTNQKLENENFYSTLQNTIVVTNFDTTTKSEQIEETNNGKSLLWLFLLLLLFLFCFCCLIFPLIWWFCFSKQRQNTNVFMILRRRWRNLKLKMGVKQTQQPTLLPTTITTAPIIPQESGISIISESVEEAPGIVAERENTTTLKIPTIGEVGRIATLAQAWQQQHQQSKIFDDSEDYLIMEEGEEEIGGTNVDLRRQSSITTFLDKGKTIEKKDTTTTTKTTTTEEEEEKIKKEEEVKDEEDKKPIIEIQKSSTSTTTETVGTTKMDEINKEIVEELIKLPKLSIEKIEGNKQINEKEELLPPRSSSVTSRPGTPTIWDQFKVLGEQYSGGDDQIALATERRDSLDDILIKMDTLEKQKTERSEIIEELNEHEEGKEVIEEENKKIKIEENIEEIVEDKKEEEKIEQIKLEEEIIKFKEIEEEENKLPRIEKMVKKNEEFKKKKNLSIPLKKLATCSPSPLFESKIKIKKECPRLAKIEKINNKEEFKKDEKKDVYVVVKGYRVKEKERKTHVLSEKKEKHQEKQLQKLQQIIPLKEERKKVKEDDQNIKLGIRQRRECLLKLRAQQPIRETSFDEEIFAEPTFDPDLPSTSNYQYSFNNKLSDKQQNLNKFNLPQIGKQIEQKIHSGCILSGRQPWNTNINTDKSIRLLPPLIIEQKPKSAERSPERIETLVHSGCITDREPWNSSPQPNNSISSSLSSKRLKTTENIFKTQLSGRRQPRPRPKSVRELTDPDWEKEEFTNNYFKEFSSSKRHKVTSSPDTKEESETNYNNYYYSKDLLMNRSRKKSSKEPTWQDIS